MQPYFSIDKEVVDWPLISNIICNFIWLRRKYDLINHYLKSIVIQNQQNFIFGSIENDSVKYKELHLLWKWKFRILGILEEEMWIMMT